MHYSLQGTCKAFLGGIVNKMYDCETILIEGLNDGFRMVPMARIKAAAKTLNREYEGDIKITLTTYGKGLELTRYDYGKTYGDMDYRLGSLKYRVARDVAGMRVRSDVAVKIPTYGEGEYYNGEKYRSALRHVGRDKNQKFKTKIKDGYLHVRRVL